MTRGLLWLLSRVDAVLDFLWCLVGPWHDWGEPEPEDDCACWTQCCERCGWEREGRCERHPQKGPSY